jgi:hypothetical protein
MMQQNGGIVMYRSRAEMEIDKMIWEGDGSTFEIFGTVLMMAIVGVITLSKLQRKIRNTNVLYTVSIASALIGGYVLAKAFGWLVLAI